MLTLLLAYVASPQSTIPAAPRAALSPMVNTKSVCTNTNKGISDWILDIFKIINLANLKAVC